MDRARIGGLVAVAVGALVLAWLWVAPVPDPARTPRPADGPGPGRAARGPVSPHGDGGGGSALASRAEASSAGGSPRVPAEGPPDLSRPAAASAFVEEQVLELLAVVAPEADPKDFARHCTGEGRTCTFEGPWPADDFFERWVLAIADGRTGIDAMEGVTISRFERVEQDGEVLLVLEAHLP